METIRPSTESLEALVRVVDCGSITAAAERLHTSKSVISKRIHQLEQTLGSRLFHRTGRQMRPTDSGLIVYEHACRLLERVSKMVDDVAGHSEILRGTLRVNGPRSFGQRYLSPLILAFMQAHPQINVVLDLDDRYSDLRAGDYDLLVRIGRLKDSAMKARRLADSPRGIFCSPVWLRKLTRPIVTPQDLLDYPLLGYAHARPTQSWHFIADSSQKPQCLTISPRLLSDNGEVLRDAAIGGIGIAALPHFLAQDALRSGELSELILPGFQLPSDTLYALYPETVTLPARVRVLIDFLAEQLPSSLSAIGDKV